MADVTAMREGLRDRLATIQGLRAHATIPDNISPPAAIVGGADLSFDLTFARGADKYTFAIRLLVSRASDRAGQDALDSYLESGATPFVTDVPENIVTEAPTYFLASSSNSIKRAIEGDPTLGGVAMTTRVTSMRGGYGVYSVAGVDYIGAELLVEVIA